jgi:protein farnesyltransferase subunit beta
MSSSQPEPSPAPSAQLEELLTTNTRIEELSDSSGEYEDMGAATEEEQANIAYLDSVRIPIKDQLQTDTSEVEAETLEAVLPFLEGNPNDFPLNIFGIPQLQREKHVAYLKKQMGDMPSAYAVMDASRPWLVYWSLQGISALGHDVSEYRDRYVLLPLVPQTHKHFIYHRFILILYSVIHTFALAQHPTGGHGGGYGQLPHLAATYAATLSLVMVGGAPAYESINRKAMWQYLGRMKQADGGFTMAAGGEEDIRGAYCALVILSLLHIPLELPPDAPARAHGLTTFTDKLGEWVSRCQAFDGGMSAAPGNEAHGAYAFCGLGCLSIIGPPKETLNRYLDMPALIHWLSARQCSPEGGYNGRTNKLVDGCYSHWVGGCWALVEAATTPSLTPQSTIWNRSALARYILSAAQARKGGLIDKPGKRPDAYHSCYNLAGLSATQHKYAYEADIQREIGGADLDAAYYWKAEGLFEEGRVWGDEDAVEEVHPVFVVPFKAVHECRRYFDDKEGF